uniref:HMG box domain-containing protein n=1 Tax=Strongyloides venezuelensis TaxID=75913 RepID=A0A0K0FMT1_STRVS
MAATRRAVKREASEMSGSDDEKNSQTIEGIKMPISELLTLCKTIVESNGPIAKRRGTSKLSSALEQNHFSIPLNEVEESFRNAYRYSTRRDSITCEFMAHAIMQRFTRGDIVSLYPDFPKRPLPLYNEFLVLCGHKNLFASPPPEIKEAFADLTNKNRIKAQEIYERNVREFNGKLEQFLDEHINELNDEQKEYTRKQIIDLGKPTRRNVKKPAHKKTAYDFFKQAKKSKYADMSDEAREKKLQKAFKKLKADELEIYEELASNQ